MAHCCNETIRPRMLWFVISDWYRGTQDEARPIDTPEITLPVTSIPRFCAAHWRMEPTTQIHADAMIVGLLPKTSANLVTKRAPKKEPAGMDATMAPWALDPGNPNVLLYASFWRNAGQSANGQATKVEEHERSRYRTWTICPDRTDRLRYMRTTPRGTEGGSDSSTMWTKPKPTHGVGRDPGAILEAEKRTL